MENLITTRNAFYIDHFIEYDTAMKLPLSSRKSPMSRLRHLRPANLKHGMPLVSIVPTQLFACYTSRQRGYDVDKSRNLAKNVMVE